MVTLSLAFLGVAALLCVVRLVRSESLVDRAVALDMLVVVVVSGIAADAVRRGSGIYLDVLVVAALLGFAGTALVAAFIERRMR